MLVVFAIWTYVAWVVVLSGAEVSNSGQHFRSTTFPREQFGSVPGNHLSASDMITLFLIVAEHFSKGRGACPPEQGISLSGTSEDVVDRCLKRFKAARLIYEVDGDTIGFFPARGLVEIMLQQIVDAAEGNTPGHLALDIPSEACVYSAIYGNRNGNVCRRLRGRRCCESAVSSQSGGSKSTV